MWGRGVLAVLLVGGCAPGERDVELRGAAFGTTWLLRAEGRRELGADEVEAELAAWSEALSHWSESSDVVRFNRSRSTAWFAVDEKLVRAVRLAEQVAEETGGALDVTIGPLVAAWGFGPEGRTEAPTEEGLRALRERSGWRHLQWRMVPPALRKGIPDLEINVAAVAEGLAMEGVEALVEADGAGQWMLELGGEVVVRGPEARVIAVQSPTGGAGEAFAKMSVFNAAVCTSGTYRHRREVNGEEVSHVIDPRTGWPVSHGLESVTVSHASPALADGYATALLVLGPTEGRRVAERLGLNVVFIERQ